MFCDIKQAADFLKKGEVVAFPTETVYGLGGSVWNENALKKIFSLKGRPSDNPLIVHLSQIDDVHLVAVDIPLEFYLLANHFFPGPLTVILKKHPSLSEIVTAGLSTVALRFPSHPIAQALLQETNFPIAAPSANLSGRPSPTKAEHVYQDFKEKVPIVEGGECEIGIESTVLNLVGPLSILRPGAITAEQLEEVLQKKVSKDPKKDLLKASPGNKYRHYAPKAEIFLFSSWEEMEKKWTHSTKKKVAILAQELPPSSLQELFFYTLSPKLLYHLFRSSDEKGYEELWILCNEEVKNNRALYNRIIHAQGGGIDV